MKNDIPEYFVALVKQYANLSSNEQAYRAIENITDSTEVNNLLKAYLKSVCIVIGPQKTSNIKSILPVELSKLNYE